MSYEIFYDKRFLKVGEGKYIPIVQTGSNNTWEYNWSGREIPEKNWNCISYPFSGRYVFSEAEVMEIAESSKKFDNAKSRGKFFSEDEFVRMYKNGIRGAKPLEFYIELGNTFEVRDRTDYRDVKCKYPKTTEEMLGMIEELKEKGASIGLGFSSRNLYLPKKNKVEREKVLVEQDHYYLLASGSDYFCGLKKYGYTYARFLCSSTKKFKTEKEAARYLKKYPERLKHFEVKKVEESYGYYS